MDIARPDWRGGFLFVANHLSLDFLNTRLVINGDLHELLPDISSLVRWLCAAGFLKPSAIGETIRRWEDRPGALAFLDRLKNFREELRSAVFNLEARRRPDLKFLKELNRILVQHPTAYEMYVSGSQICRRKRFDPQVPEDSLQPIADAAASLFSEVDTARVRKCESCAAHFYDISKKGARRWCSMQICGNKHKVAAYGRRQKARQSRS